MNRLLRSMLVVGAAWLGVACGPDRKRDQCIAAHPNFVVLITAPPGMTLPSDLVVKLRYGGSGMETYRLSQPGNQQVLFCTPAALDGGPLLAADGGMDGGATSADALRCELWTGGPAQLEIDAMTLAPSSTDLTPLESSCTLNVMIPVEQADAG